MKNDKINPALNMALPDIKENKTAINGKAAPKYVPILVHQAVLCQNCGQVAVPDPNRLTFVKTGQELETLAENMHTAVITQKRIICSTPKLIYTYASGYMFAE